MKADYGSYFVTTYKTTWRERDRKKEKQKEESQTEIKLKKKKKILRRE